MKKIIALIIGLVVWMGSQAQLTEYYPNSQRYLFNEYNRDSLSIDSIPAVCAIHSHNYWWIVYPDIPWYRTVLAQKYYRQRSDSVIVYGVALPLYIYECYTDTVDNLRLLHYYGMDIRDRENDSLWNSRFETAIDSLTSDNKCAYLHRYNDSHSEFLDVVDSVYMQRGISIVTGNDFEFPNYGNWPVDTVHPYSLRVPVIEVYFKEPHIMYDSFWVGANDFQNSISLQVSMPSMEYSFGCFAVYDPSFNSNLWSIQYSYWKRNTYVQYIEDQRMREIVLMNSSQYSNYYYINHLWGGLFPIVTPPPCMQPCSLRVESMHYDSVRVQWEVPVRVGVCRVEYGPSGFALGSGTVIDSVWGGECLIGGLQPNTTYDVYVSGWCKDQECWSGWTDTTFTTDEACPTKFDYGITAVTDTSMHVVWAVPEGAVYSEVWYGEQGAEWDDGVYVTPIYPAATGMCHLQITGLESGTSYTVSIRHWCEYGDVYSEWQSTGATTIAYYTVTAVANNADWGTVTGSGEYLAGSQAMLNAIPANEYCHFVIWDDGVTYQMRMVTVTGDMTFRALFYCDTCTESISEAAAGEITLTPNPAHGEVTVSSSTTIQRITVHDMQGRKVAGHDAGSSSVTIPLRHLPRGTYIVTVTTDKATTTRKLVIE